MNELSDKLSRSITLDDLASAMESHLKTYGFSGFAYWTHLRVPLKQLSHENSFYVSRGPAYIKTFEALYFGKKLYEQDPILITATTASEPFTTEQVRKSTKPMSRKQRWLQSLERRFGFTHDLYIPVHTPMRVQIFYVYMQGRDPSNQVLINDLLPTLTGDVALFAANVIDFINIRKSKESSNLIFTVREQECLAWMAKGRSNRDIAQILNVSERTIKFHIKNLMLKLGADNRTHAVAIAARSGWVMN